MINYDKLLLIPLRPFGIFYGWLMRFRAWLYKKRILGSTKIPVPVISVGNLTMGGSGKTPVVIYLAELLIRNGYKPAVISRGYRGLASGQVNVVADGRDILMDTSQSGDEPQLIAEAVPGLVVITGKKRALPCNYAVEVYNCDVVILDDGFQHLSTQRSLDLVLFTVNSLQEKMYVLPGGILREPFSALQRADSFIITGCRNINSYNINMLPSHLSEYKDNKTIFCNASSPCCLFDKKRNIYHLSQIVSPILAFCGIASPLRFKSTLEEMEIECADFLIYRDHEQYTSATIKKIEKRAYALGCGMIITTTKDMVKLKTLKTTLPIYALSMGVTFDTAFDNYVLKRLLQVSSSQTATSAGEKSGLVV